MADGLTFTWSAEALAKIDAAMDQIKYGTQRVAAEAYYPASMEYGFMTVNGKHVPGRHYLAGSMAAGSDSYRESVLEAIEKNIDEAWGD